MIKQLLTPRPILVVLFCVILFAGCSSTPSPEGKDWKASGYRNPLETPTQVYFEYPTDGNFTDKTFYNFPYPHDLRLSANGTPNLTGFPAPKREKTCTLPSTNNSTLNTLLGAIDPDNYVKDLVNVTHKQAKGFSLNPGIFFRFNQALHEKSIPPVSATLTADSPFFLVNIDKNSKERGQRVPVMVSAGLKSRFLPDTVVVMRPLPGFVLHPKTTYAAVILTSAYDQHGWPLVAHNNLQALATATPPPDPVLQKLHPHYQPMFALIQEKWQIQPQQVAAATVFTTGDPLSALKNLQAYIANEMPAPQTPKNLRCATNAATTPYITCTGTYESPQFQKGKTPYLDADSGYFTYNDQGKPNYQLEDLRIAITIPKRYMQPGSLSQRPIPIVMYAHGTGGSYTSMINDNTARTLANQGIAGFGIDQAVNGNRTTTLAGTKLDFLFFNAINLPAARDNVRQSALDYYWQTRYIPTLQVKYQDHTFVFDPQKIWFMGHSQGGLTGPLVLAYEKNVRAAYLSAPGGFLIHTLLYKTQPAEPILLPAVIDYILCDEKKSISVFHPILSLVQNFFDPADPVNYTPPMLDGSRPPLQLLMTEGLTDQYAPPQVFEPLAIAMGLPLLGPELQPLEGLRIRQIQPYTLPVRGNFYHPSGAPMTVGFTQHQICKYDSGVPCDGHFVAFHNENAQRNWLTFFQSLLYDDVAHIH